MSQGGAIELGKLGANSYVASIVVGSGGGGGGGMVFRGEWSPVLNYQAGDVVVIRGGVMAGCYICVVDVGAGTPPTFPADSDFWVMLSPGPSMGNWQ